MDGYGSTTPAALAYAAMLDQWNAANPGAPRIGGGPGDKGLGWMRSLGGQPPVAVVPHPAKMLGWLPQQAGGPRYLGPPVRQSGGRGPGPGYLGPPIRGRSVNKRTHALLQYLGR